MHLRRNFIYFHHKNSTREKCFIFVKINQKLLQIKYKNKSLIKGLTV